MAIHSLCELAVCLRWELAAIKIDGKDYLGLIRIARDGR